MLVPCWSCNKVCPSRKVFAVCHVGGTLTIMLQHEVVLAVCCWIADWVLSECWPFILGLGGIDL